MIQQLEACGVDLYLDQQAIDTTAPMGKLVFQVTGAFAEFERSMIRQRVKLGLKRAIAKGVKLGRPKVDSTIERKIERHLASSPMRVFGRQATSEGTSLSAAGPPSGSVPASSTS